MHLTLQHLYFCQSRDKTKKENMIFFIISLLFLPYARCMFSCNICIFCMYVCIFIWIKGTGYNPRDHTHQDISLVHLQTQAPFRESKDCNWIEMYVKVIIIISNTYPARKDQRNIINN